MKPIHTFSHPHFSSVLFNVRAQFFYLQASFARCLCGTCRSPLFFDPRRACNFRFDALKCDFSVSLLKAFVLYVDGDDARVYAFCQTLYDKFPLRFRQAFDFFERYGRVYFRVDFVYVLSAGSARSGECHFGVERDAVVQFLPVHTASIAQSARTVKCFYCHL